MSLGLSIGVSKTLHPLFQSYRLIEPGSIHSMDVTVILLEDHGDWVNRHSRTIRPHLVATIDDARRILKMYSSLG